MSTLRQLYMEGRQITASITDFLRSLGNQGYRERPRRVDALYAGQPTSCVRRCAAVGHAGRKPGLLGWDAFFKSAAADKPGHIWPRAAATSVIKPPRVRSHRR